MTGLAQENCFVKYSTGFKIAIRTNFAGKVLSGALGALLKHSQFFPSVRALKRFARSAKVD